MSEATPQLTPEQLAAREQARKRIQARLKAQRTRRERMRRIDLAIPSLYPVQAEIKAEARRFNVLNIGRRAGKSYLGIHLALDAVAAGKRVGWFSPTYKYLLDVWDELERPLKAVKAKINTTNRRMQLPNGGIIECWTLEDDGAGRSRKYHTVIIDEAAKAGNLKTAWEKAIRATLTDYEGTAWFLSTPDGLNYFHDLYVRGVNESINPEWKSWKLPSSVNPYLMPGEIEAARRELPERVFQQEYLAEFMTNDGAVFRGVEAILNAPATKPTDHAGHFLLAGVDWGRTHDFTAVSVFCCHCACEVALDRFNQVGWEFQRGRILALMEKWGVREMIVETNSIGGPNLEALRKRMPEKMYAVGFETTSRSKGPMVQALALAIERANLRLLPNEQAKHELLSYQAEVLPSGYTRYSAPEGQWDDTVIARGLVWWFAKSRTPYPSTFDEQVEGALPAGWRAENAFGEPGSWERDAWMMAREVRRTEIENALKKRTPSLDDRWEPVGGLSNVREWDNW